MAQEYLSLSEVAERYGLCKQTVRTWARNGKLPAVKLGSGSHAPYRISRKTLEDFETANVVAPVK